MLKLVFLAVNSLLAAISLLAYYQHYWRWRDCFDAQGLCEDPATGQTYLEASGRAWLILTLIFSILALLQYWRYLNAKSRSD